MVKLGIIRFCLNNSPLFSETERVIIKKRNFIDSLRISVTGGNGGCGLPAYGGIGGDGGNIVFKCDSKFKSLKDFKDSTLRIKNQKKKLKADNGEDSFKYRLVGEKGKDLILKLPPGCTIKNNLNNFLGEVNEEKDQVSLPLGGEGGKKENNFLGRKGLKLDLVIDLKLISDVGFIGYPNAGKSTLLKSLCRAKPKIASYPFTTMQPNIGILEYSDYRKISCADLPGLIKNAHLNVGLGHLFLKHVHRTELLMFVISAEKLFTFENSLGIEPIEVLINLIKEIELYNATILNKPSILVMSKMDLPDANTNFDKFMKDLIKFEKKEYSSSNIKKEDLPKFLNFDLILPVSSKTSSGIKTLKAKIREVIDFYFENKLKNELNN